MSRTMRDDAIAFHSVGADRLLDGRGESYRGRWPVLNDTLLVGDCSHTNLNAAKDRCLGCGMWAHQFVAGL